MSCKSNYNVLSHEWSKHSILCIHVYVATGDFTRQQQSVSSHHDLAGKIPLSIHHHSSLFKQLAIHVLKWRVVGVCLGFTLGELDNIQDNPTLKTTAPNSWLSAMLSEWLQWAPGDSRGSTSFATLEGLKAALRDAGLGAAAHDLSFQSPPSGIDQEATLSKIYNLKEYSPATLLI